LVGTSFNTFTFKQKAHQSAQKYIISIVCAVYKITNRLQINIPPMVNC